MHARAPHPSRRKAQTGIVLIVSLIMLVVISMLAVLSMRNTASTEQVAGAVRTTELATQAAEIALRHCEQSLMEVIKVAGGAAPSYTTTFTLEKILPASSVSLWQSTTVWDSASTATFVLPMAMLNQAGMAYDTFKRPPECMVAPLVVVPNGSSVPTSTSAFVITARGFGPEVAAANPSRSRPVGTEIWLQSRITLE